MSTRDDFLAAVGERLRHGIPENPLRPIAPVPNPPIEYTVDTASPVERFEAAAAAVGAEVLGTSAADFPDVFDGMVDEVEPRRVALADHPLAALMREVLTGRDIEVVPVDDVAAVASAELGVTGAIAGIALTGSIVLDSSQRGARLASLLPDVHVALLDRQSIVPTPGDLLRSLSARATPLPSNLVLVTGPSRSADIELQLTVGVHGPRRVLIVLL